MIDTKVKTQELSYEDKLAMWRCVYISSKGILTMKPNLLIEKVFGDRVYVSSLDCQYLPIISFNRIDDQRLVVISIESLFRDCNDKYWVTDIALKNMLELLKKGFIDTISVYPIIDYANYLLEDYKTLPVLVLSSSDEDTNLNLKLWNKYVIDSYTEHMPYKSVVLGNSINNKFVVIFNKDIQSFECVDRLEIFNKTSGMLLRKYVVSNDVAMDIYTSRHCNSFTDIKYFNSSCKFTLKDTILNLNVYPFTDVRDALLEIGILL